MRELKRPPRYLRRLPFPTCTAAPAPPPPIAADSLCRPSLASNSKMMRRNKKRKVTSTTSPPLPTTIASLPDDVVADILLRLPSAAAIYRAAFASKHWIRAASCPTFLRRLRDVHRYPLLLGHFVAPDGQGSTPPHFQPVPLHSEAADGVVAAMVRRGDFFLTRLQQAQGSGRHVLVDCSGGLLLFSDRGALCVFDPMTHRVSLVEHLPRRDGRTPDHRGRTLCLLPNGDDPDAFRVMSLQHGSDAQLEVYNSCTRDWRVITAKVPARHHMAQIYHGQTPAMHAGDRIYWKYSLSRSYVLPDSLLSLDTKKMTFSDVRLPPGMTRHSNFAVGETEDNTRCLVHVLAHSRWSRLQMQVWRFKSGDDHEGNENETWELERQVPLILNSPSARLEMDQVRAIVGGIVLLSFKKTSPYQHHTAFRLKSLKVEADFTCRGLARPFVIE